MISRKSKRRERSPKAGASSAGKISVLLRVSHITPTLVHHQRARCSFPMSVPRLHVSFDASACSRPSDKWTNGAYTMVPRYKKSGVTLPPPHANMHSFLSQTDMTSTRHLRTSPFRPRPCSLLARITSPETRPFTPKTSTLEHASIVPTDPGKTPQQCRAIIFTGDTHPG